MSEKLLLNFRHKMMLEIVGTEAVSYSCSVKKVFLENSQNSQENTCTRVSFLIKLQAWGLVFSSEFCKISENSFSYTTPPVAPSIGNNVTLNYPVMTLPDNLLLICRFKDHNLVFCSLSLHKKWSFPLRISSANVTKSAGNFLCSVYIWFAKYGSWKLHLEPQTLYAIKKTYFGPDLSISYILL